MRVAVFVFHRFAGAEQLAVLFGELQPVDYFQVELAQFFEVFPVIAV